VLHSCPQIAPGKARYAEAARDELIRLLTQYSDAAGVPITVVFDGTRARRPLPKVFSRPEMEILYSKRGQTADDVIERATERLLAYGEVMVVTDDFAERETVLSLGGMAVSCSNFLDIMHAAVSDFQKEVQRQNRREKNRFKETASKNKPTR